MKHILIVEDNPVILKAVKIKFKLENFKVTSFDNGYSALEFLNQHSPDLILTDLMMPFATGYEIIELVKNKLPKIPIIIFSVLGQDRIKHEALELGVDEFLVKPFDMNELAQRVKKYL